ncbi:hypothetical protein [Paraliomyxa miuraensis]|uniref:hypothetical protein n=1 Tax=Paraliomyxa miuraensis TaxID=376150 RepID=UPI0022539AD2|nr:hypothetical protein [Paraliomyxa miuraensis]MCX4239879.1 hypothetical protein [Paraliomyxa miuraensis]
MSPFLRALWRYGGLLVRPRATVAALEADEGRHDGLVLGLLYLFGVGTLELLRGVAAARVTADLGGLLMLASALGRVLVVPIVVLVACETVLGRVRSHRRGLMLVPLLVVVTVAHELAAHGHALPSLWPEVAGGSLCVGWAWWVRPAVEPEEAEA